MKKLKRFWLVLKKTGSSFFEDNGMKLSASLSYYTIFALGPILLIIISVAGSIFGREAAQGKVDDQIKGLLGPEAALQIQEIIKNISQTGDSVLGTIIGIVLLIVGATGVFVEMQDSINYIWSVKAKPKKGWLKLIKDRLLSFSLVVVLGFLLLVSLVMSAAVETLSSRLESYFPDNLIYLFYALNIIIVLAVISGLFAVIYKVLPDAVISWKDAFIGAIFTAVLFIIGKFLIGLYLGNSDIGVTYGAAASVIIILLWVYYSSIILYFGAEFTKIRALELGHGIKPKKTAVFIVKEEKKEIPETHDHPEIKRVSER